MPEFKLPHRSVSSTGAFAAGVGAGPAAEELGSGFTPPSDCGKVDDPDTLWTSVKNATPPDVVIPDTSKSFGYAVRNGNDPGVQKKYNLLLIPAPVSAAKTGDARIKGIECAKIWQDNALNLWPHAWTEATKRFALDPSLVMLGINSFHGRSHNQLHIHLTAFDQKARQAVDNLANQIPIHLTRWNESMFAVPGETGKYVYRIVHVSTLDKNLFTLLKDHVSQDDMFQQSLAVVTARHGGYYLLNTQGKPDTGEPPHQPELRLPPVGHADCWGTQTVEDLMYRG